MARLRDKVAIITGAASGVGRAAAALFAREGAKVALLDVDTEGGEAAAREVEQEGGQAMFIACDVSSGTAVERAVAAVVDRYGEVHVLYNNAAIGYSAGILYIA